MVRSNSMIPTDGSVYVFMNRTRTRMKLLHWERGGYVIFYKRMEQGRISHTVFKSDERSVFKQLRWDELVLLVEGICGLCDVIAKDKATIADKATIISERDKQIAKMHDEINWLKRKLFGRSSEKLHAEDPNQLSFRGGCPSNP